MVASGHVYRSEIHLYKISGNVTLVTRPELNFLLCLFQIMVHLTLDLNSKTSWVISFLPSLILQSVHWSVRTLTLFSGARVWLIRNPRSKTHWSKHSCHGGEQERVRETGVSDENDRGHKKTDRFLSGRILRDHSQAADINLWWTRVGAAHIWVAEHRPGWPES